MTEKSAPGATPSTNLPIVIHAQYVKDVSFENPQAPNSLRAGPNGMTPPKMDINFNLDSREIEDPDVKNLYEVTLRLSARAERDGHTIFVCEVLYGAAVSLRNVPEEQQHPMMMIEVPRMIFPFARQILADLTQQGGYPPLMLGPVDFFSMYMSRFGKNNGEAAN